MELVLSNGMKVLYDEVDHDAVMRVKWYAVRSKRTYYAETARYFISGRRVRGMHHLIMQPPQGMVVDHVNGNGLDNRRANLRICTPNQNRRNTRSYTGSSRYKGVAFHKRDRRWAAHICANGRDIWLGYHKTEEGAALAYNAAAVRYHGNFAALNILGGTES
jgi:hypothetical protein